MADNVISKIKLPDNQEYILKDSNAARSNHTHTTTLAEDSTDTSSVSLKAGTKYKLTSGGTSYTFTTPADTNDKVTQTATTTSANYEILFSGTADNTNHTEGARKTSTLTYNPNTKDLSTGGKINGYTLAAASARSIDNEIGNASASTNLPTSKAVAAFVEGKRYVTSSGVTQVGTGVGLTGGTITGTGTIKANLTSETKLTNAAADGTETAGRVYPVRLDKDGKLAVNVPWTNSNGNYLTGATTTGTGNAITAVEKNGQSLTFTKGTTFITSVNGHTGSVVNVTAGDLGLSSALRYVGKTTSTMSESFTGVPAGISGYTKPIVGDVVLDSAGNGEYVCIAVSGTTYTWELLGAESSFKKVQTAVFSPSAGDSAQIEFINTISQDAQGVISATKQPIRTASTTQTGVIQITKNNANLFLNALDTGSSTPTDNDYYISQYVGGGTTTTTYHRRPVSKLYDYIKSKTDTLYPTKAGDGATGTWGIGISGNAATATKFASAQSITLTGDTTGTKSSQAGWSISTVNKYITGRGRLESANIENTSYLSKFFTFLASSSMTEGKPVADGSIAYFGWDNNGWAGELYIPNAKNGQLQFRGASNSDEASDWEDWVTVLDTRNYTTTLDSTYVKKADGVTAVTWDYANKTITRTINGTVANVVEFVGTSPITVTGADNKLTIAHNGNSGYKHIPSGGSSGQFLGWDSDGTAKWVANPNSDTKVTLAAITSGTAYYPVVGTGTGNAQRQIDTAGFAYKGTNGTTSAVGAAELTLGNSTASGTANNKQGKLTLYGSTAYTHTLLGAPTSARTITLPDATGTVELTSHIHGNLSHDGKITSTTTIANGDKLVIVDSDTTAGGKITGSTITFDGSTATKALTQKGTWETFNNYSHPTGDGNLHVPATGTTHNGQVLKAGSTAGSISWGTLSASDVGALAVGGNAVSATTATNLSAAPTITATGTATVNLAANTAYTLTVGGKSVVFKTPSDANTNTLVNYTLGETTKAYLMASQNAPTTTTTARAAHGDTGVYLTATAGEFSAVRHSYNVAGAERAYTHYNMTDQSIDFVFV